MGPTGASGRLTGGAGCRARCRGAPPAHPQVRSCPAAAKSQGSGRCGTTAKWLPRMARAAAARAAANQPARRGACMHAWRRHRLWRKCMHAPRQTKSPRCRRTSAGSYTSRWKAVFLMLAIMGRLISCARAQEHRGWRRQAAAAALRRRAPRAALLGAPGGLALRPGTAAPRAGRGWRGRGPGSRCQGLLEGGACHWSRLELGNGRWRRAGGQLIGAMQRGGERRQLAPWPRWLELGRAPFVPPRLAPRLHACSTTQQGVPSPLHALTGRPEGRPTSAPSKKPAHQRARGRHGGPGSRWRAGGQPGAAGER